MFGFGKRSKVIRETGGDINAVRRETAIAEADAAFLESLAKRPLVNGSTPMSQAELERYHEIQSRRWW